MPPDLDDDSLHSLLAPGGLSGAQRERILERVLDEHALERPARRWWVIGASAALPAAALVALMLGSFADAPPEGRDNGWLVPKGDAKGAVFEARCPNRARGECRQGDRLIFELDGVKNGGFFAAYAECEGRERIWYFPTSDGRLPALPARPGHVVVNQAVRIGEEHGVGRCALHLFVLDQPRDRATLIEGTARPPAAATLPITVTR